MLNAIFKFFVYRVAGARILLALTLLGWVRRLIGSRRPNPIAARNPSSPPPPRTFRDTEAP